MRVLLVGARDVRATHDASVHENSRLEAHRADETGHGAGRREVGVVGELHFARREGLAELCLVDLAVARQDHGNDLPRLVAEKKRLQEGVARLPE